MSVTIAGEPHLRQGFNGWLTFTMPRSPTIPLQEKKRGYSYLPPTQRKSVATRQLEIIGFGCFVYSEKFKFHRSCGVSPVKTYRGIIFCKKPFVPKWLDFAIFTPFLSASDFVIPAMR